MIKIYSIVSDKCRKFKNTKIYIFEKTWDLSIICINCGNKYKNIFTGKESIKVFKILDLIIL